MAFVKGGGSRLFFDMTALGSDTAGTINGDGIELPFTTESFNPVGEFVSSNAIAGGRSRGIGCIGNKAGDGSLDTEISIENFLYLMYSALGTYKEVTDTTDFPVVYPSINALPTYDVYIQHGATDYTLQYKFLNQKVNNFRMTLASNSILTASIDMVGTSQEKLGSIVEPDVALSSTYVCPAKLTNAGYTPSVTKATEAFNDTGTDMLGALSSFDLTIANNIDTDTNKLDASGRMGTIAGELSVTGSMDFILNDTIQSDLESLDIGSRWDAVYLTLDNASPDITYYLHLRNMYFTSVTHNIDSRGKLTVSVDFQCANDSTMNTDGTSDAKITGLQNEPIILISSAKTGIILPTTIA